MKEQKNNKDISPKSESKSKEKKLPALFTKKDKEAPKKVVEKNNYDWFQGKAGTANALTPRQKLHKVWKVFRMFLYVSLAALSLTGCIQSFVIKTPSGVGRGMELYASKSDVAPHVTTLKLSKDGSLTVDTKTQYWINRNESDPVLKKANNKTLTEIQKQVGEGFFTWMTENNAIRVTNEDGLGIKTFGADASKEATVLKLKNDKYVVIGSGDKRVGHGLGDKPKTRMSIPTITMPYYFQTGEKTTKTNPTVKKWEKVLVNFTIKEQKNDTQLLNAHVFKEYLDFAKTQSLFTDAEDAFNNLNTPTPKGESLLAMRRYMTNIQNLSSIFAIGDWKVFNYNKATKISTAELHPSASLVHLGNHYNLLAAHQSSGNKQRAIYDWSRAWTLGPFYGLFVYPISQLVLGIQGGLPSASAMHGWETVLTLFLAVFIIRSFAYALTFKSTLQQVKQQELSAKKATIEAKYAQYKGNKQMEQRKRQEMSEMFKKEGVSPLGSIGTVFLTMPIFLSMWKIIGGLAQFKSTDWLGINFSQTSWRELIYNKGWQYLPLMLLAAVIQGLSIILPRVLTRRRDKTRMNAQQKEAMKKANKTQNIMAIVFIVMAIIMSAGIQVYWIFGGIFTTGQNVLNHFIIKKQSQKRKSQKIKA